MAQQSSTSSHVLFVTLNLFVFTLVISTSYGYPTSPLEKPNNPTQAPTTNIPTSNPTTSIPTPTANPIPTVTPSIPSPTTSNIPTVTPTIATPTQTSSTWGRCPRDALKIGLCVKALNLVDVTVGKPPVQPCCTLIQGLTDLEAAVCLCTSVKASILGSNLNVPVDLTLLLNVCSRKAPRDFQCANTLIPAPTTMPGIPNPSIPNTSNPLPSTPTNPKPSPTNLNPTTSNIPIPAPTIPNPTSTMPRQSSSTSGRCPRDALKFGLCVKALDLVDVTVGKPPVQPCCTLIQGLADLEAAICLCTAVRGSVLGNNLNVPIDITLFLNVCSRQAPRDFQCA